MIPALSFTTVNIITAACGLYMSTHGEGKPLRPANHLHMLHQHTLTNGYHLKPRSRRLRNNLKNESGGGVANRSRRTRREPPRGMCSWVQRARLRERRGGGVNKQSLFRHIPQSLSEARWAGGVSVELVQAAKRIMGRYD